MNLGEGSVGVSCSALATILQVYDENLRWKYRWLETPFMRRGSLSGNCWSEWLVELLWLGSPQCQDFQAFASWGQWLEVISSLPPSWKRQSPVGESGAGRVGRWVGLTLHSFCSSQGPSVFSGKPVLSSAGVAIHSGFLLSSGAGRDGRRPRGFGNLQCSLHNLFQPVFLLLPSSTPLILLVLGIMPLKSKTKHQNSSFTAVLEKGF